MHTRQIGKQPNKLEELCARMAPYTADIKGIDNSNKFDF
jgi:hypothetical protein